MLCFAEGLRYMLSPTHKLLASSYLERKQRITRTDGSFLISTRAFVVRVLGVLGQAEVDILIYSYTRCVSNMQRKCGRTTHILYVQL